MGQKKDSSLLSRIPGVDTLLEHPAASRLFEVYARPLVMQSIRETLDRLREEIRKSEGAPVQVDVSAEGILQRVEVLIGEKLSPHMKRVINATGVLLHTNLGRSLLAEEAIEAMKLAARAPCNLELDLDSGKRGHRHSHVESLLCQLTGAEAATVVNNNAAAVMLCLNTVAEGKEVITSRGQLVEIGGSFRLPDVVSKSGARLVEVGTTNRTYLRDYEKIITDKTGALLAVHPSNFIVVGFTADVPVGELVELGVRHHLPVVYDLGSGALVDLSAYGLEKEPMVQEAVEQGVDLVTFSGDKLLGGPQAGIIVGKKDVVRRVAENPLKRALRLDKCTLAALEATLRIYLAEPDLGSRLPIFRFLSRPIEEITTIASALVGQLSTEISRQVAVSVEDGHSRVGGGSLPIAGLPTKVIALRPIHISPDELAARLRRRPIPVIVRIHQDTVLFDLRTIRRGEEHDLLEVLRTLDYEPSAGVKS